MEHERQVEQATPVATRRRILAVVNPVAGPLGSQRATRDLRERARKLGVELETVETRPDFSGEDAVLSSLGPHDCYLAVGGDGTVMEVAAAAMIRGVPLAILPRGTANAVAWHFGVPFDVARALKVAMEGRPIRIDVGRSGQRDFLIMAGLGYDAHVIQDATRELKRRLGFLAYLYAAVRNFGRRPYVFRIWLDDGKPIHLPGASAVVANLGSLAGNFRAVKGISPQDGLLDLIVFSPANFRDFFRMVLWGLVGRLEQDPRVQIFRAGRIKIETRPLAPLQIDGEHLPGRAGALEAEVLPGALTVLVPPEGMSRLPWVPDLNWPNPAISRGISFVRGTGFTEEDTSGAP